MDREAPLLRASGVTWEAGGRRILGPLDLEVAAGDCLAVVGPNGAGKTTLLRLLSGLLAPTAGAVRWRETPLDRLPRRRLARHIAYVPQLRPTRIPLTVEQIVLQGRYPYLSPLQLAPARRDHAAVEQALELVELVPLRHRLVSELSGGERQAVFVAAALAQEAELLVLDEPTTHLDARHQLQITALLRRLNRHQGRTVVLATHDLNLASFLAGRVLALRRGRELASGPPRDLLRPELLSELFDASFEVVPHGERSLIVLDPGGAAR